MEEGGKEEGEGEEPEGEEGGTPVRWRRPNLGRYSPRRGVSVNVFIGGGRWIHQAEGSPAHRKGEEEEAARATATRFFFDGRMRERGASFILRFICFLLFGGERGKGLSQLMSQRDRTKAGMVEGGFILRSECISRVIKFDSKQTKQTAFVLTLGQPEGYSRIKEVRTESGGRKHYGAAIVVPGCRRQSDDSHPPAHNHQLSLLQPISLQGRLTRGPFSPHRVSSHNSTPSLFKNRIPREKCEPLSPA
jgi:hypothetical protein